MADQNEKRSPGGIPSNGRSRVHPWVSYVLILALGGASVWLYGASPKTPSPGSDDPAVVEARALFERNPEVEMSDRLVRLIGPRYVADVRAEHRAGRELGSTPQVSRRTLGRAQRRFDALEEAVAARLEQTQPYRYGVTRESPVENTLYHLAVHDNVQSLAISIAFLGLLSLSLEGAWGSVVFGLFFALLPLVTAGLYRGPFGVEGVPWAGPSAVVAALLGAYLVRSFKGFTIPGWILVPIWLVGEYLLARDIAIDHFDRMPLLMHGASFGFGAATALTIHFLGIEERRARRVGESGELVSNPVLDEALEASERGAHDRAFQLLEAELSRSPGNHDVAVALLEVARRSDRVARAVPALLASIRDSLRHGRRAEAAALWLSFTTLTGDPKAEATLLVRIGEALVEAGHAPAAVQAFGWATFGPKPLASVLAARVARASREIDPDLARRSAGIALADAQLDAAERAVLETLATSAPPVGPVATAAASSAPEASGARAVELGTSPPEAEFDPYQDPHAIRADAFEDVGGSEASGEVDPERWNSPGLVEDLSGELEDDGAPPPGAGVAGEEALSLEDHSGEPADAPRSGDSSGDRSADALGDDTETTETLDVDPLGAPDHLQIGVAAPLRTPRQLQVRAAAPLRLEARGLAIELDDGRKTTLAFDRVEALAVAAVRGLSEKPVILIDLALNWIAASSEPLKIVRLRSDGFDPRRFVADPGSPVESLQALLGTLLSATSATPLPDRSAAVGSPFVSFDALADYELRVLNASSGS